MWWTSAGLLITVWLFAVLSHHPAGGLIHIVLMAGLLAAAVGLTHSLRQG